MYVSRVGTVALGNVEASALSVAYLSTDRGLLAKRLTRDVDAKAAALI